MFAIVLRLGAAKNFAARVNYHLACSCSFPPPPVCHCPLKLLCRCTLTRILNHPENFTDYAQSILFTLRVAVARTMQINLRREGGREERAGGSIDRFIYARLGSNDRITSLCGKRAVARILNLNPRNVRAFHLNRPHNSSVDDFYRKVSMKI